MVPSSSTRDSRSGRSGNLSVFLATLLWSLTLCLMPLMISSATAWRLRALPIPPRFALWAIAAVTLLCAWPVRYDATRGYGVLAVSLVLAAFFFMTLR